MWCTLGGGGAGLAMVMGRTGEAGTTGGLVKAGDCELVEVDHQLLKSSLMLEMALSWLLK